MKSNRFKNLSAALKGQNLPSQQEVEKAETETATAVPLSRRKARKEGKRSDPNYVQVGVYVPKTLHLEVKKLLLEHPEMDMSDLVGELLQVWVEEHQSD